MFKNFYCHSEIKSASSIQEAENTGEERIIEGYFSTVDMDRARDVVLPSAFHSAISNFMKNPILCFNHNWDDGIGRVLSMTVDDYGCKVRAMVAKGTKKADEVWTLISQGVYNAFSFAFRVLDAEKVDDEVGGAYYKITNLDLLEVSVVTIPCNANATFSIVKGFEWGSDVYPSKFPEGLNYDVKIITSGGSGEPAVDTTSAPSVKVTATIKAGESTVDTTPAPPEPTSPDTTQPVEEAKAENTTEPTEPAVEKKNTERIDTEEKNTSVFSDFPLADIDTVWSKTRARMDMAVYASSDGSGDKDKIDWRKYRKGFFWYDENDPENFGSYKLPFCYVEDGKIVAVPRGIFASAGAVNGARSGALIPEKDVEAVKRHIEKYYKKMDRESPFKGLGIMTMLNSIDKEQIKDLIEKIEVCELFLSEYLSSAQYELDDSDLKLVGEIVSDLLLKEVSNEAENA